MTTTPQAELLSARIKDLAVQHLGTANFVGMGDFVEAIAKLQATQAEPVQAVLVPVPASWYKLSDAEILAKFPIEFPLGYSVAEGEAFCAGIRRCVREAAEEAGMERP